MLPTEQRFRRSTLRLLTLAVEAMVNRGCDHVIIRITLRLSCLILTGTELRLCATLHEIRPRYDNRPKNPPHVMLRSKEALAQGPIIPSPSPKGKSAVRRRMR